MPLKKSKDGIINFDIRTEHLPKKYRYHLEEDWQKMKAEYGFTCPSCRRKEPEIKLQRDHIKPIFKGGNNSIENIQPLCGNCNVRKGLNTMKFHNEPRKEINLKGWNGEKWIDILTINLMNRWCTDLENNKFYAYRVAQWDGISFDDTNY